MNAVKDPKQIKKVPLTHVDDVAAELRGDVLSRASKEFGYIGESFDARGPLAKALVKCGISVLNSAEVLAYMQSKKKIVKIDTLARRAAYTRFTGFASIAILNASAPFLLGQNYNVVMAIVASVIAFGAFCVIGAMVKDFSKGFEVERKTHWVSYSFGEKQKDEPMSWNGVRKPEILPYTGYIPVHVLNEALALRTEVPESTFFVYELTHSEDRVASPLPDPFLEVAHGAERYFIAVWDEREFEARM